MAIVFDEGPDHLGLLLVEHLLPVRENQVIGHTAFLGLGHEFRSVSETPTSLPAGGNDLVKMTPNVRVHQADNGYGMLRSKHRPDE